MERSLENHQSAATRSVEVSKILAELSASGVSWNDVAAKLGVSERSIRRWSQLQTSPQPSHVLRLKELVSNINKGI